MEKDSLNIDFSLDDIDINDLVEFEEGDQSSVKFVRDFLGRYVSDGNGARLSPDEGKELVGKIKLSQIPLLIDKFQEDVDKLTEEAVNPPAEVPSN